MFSPSIWRVKIQKPSILESNPWFSHESWRLNETWVDAGSLPKLHLVSHAVIMTSLMCCCVVVWGDGGVISSCCAYPCRPLSIQLTFQLTLVAYQLCTFMRTFGLERSWPLCATWPLPKTNCIPTKHMYVATSRSSWERDEIQEERTAWSLTRVVFNTYIFEKWALTSDRSRCQSWYHL